MKKIDILSRLGNAGVIMVVCGKSKEEALNACHAIIKGGLTNIELIFTVLQADQVTKESLSFYKDQSEIVIGAGTVLDAVTARLAILADAEYIVSPSFDQETAETYNLYRIPYSPGCMIITKIKTTLKSRVDIVKLFPGNAYGSSIISALKVPMPQINITPTGGVSLDNMKEQFDAGAVMVGVGGNLLAPAATGDFDKVTEVAQQYAVRIKEIKRWLLMGKAVTLGEIMLRLSTEQGTRIDLSEQLAAHYGGGGANMVIPLANYGHEAIFVTEVSDNTLGKAIKKHLQCYGVNTKQVLSGGSGLGIYYMETGSGERAVSVIYDRTGSSSAEINHLEWLLEELFQGIDIFHVSGITPVLSKKW